MASNTSSSSSSPNPAAESTGQKTRCGDSDCFMCGESVTDSSNQSKYRIQDNTDEKNPKTYEYATVAEMKAAYEKMKQDPTRNMDKVVMGTEMSTEFLNLFRGIFKSQSEKPEKPKRQFYLVISENSYGGDNKKLFLNEEDAKKYMVELVAKTGGKEDVIIQKVPLVESYNINHQAIIDALTQRSNNE